MHLTYTKNEIFTILMFRDHAGCVHRHDTPDETIMFQNGIRAERFDKIWFICNNSNKTRYIWDHEEKPDKLPEILADMFMRIMEWLHSHGMKANYHFENENHEKMLIQAIPEVVVVNDDGMVDFYDVPHPSKIENYNDCDVFVGVDKDNFVIDLKPLCTKVIQLPKKAIF
jgi:hypothetical protein